MQPFSQKQNMNRIPCKAVLFDLDGTLIDSLGDLAATANRALEDMGFPAHPVDAYRYFVGDGLAVLAGRIVPAGSSKEQIDEVIERFNYLYEKNWNRLTRPYPGIVDMLSALSGLPLSLAILSNKPDEFTQIYVSHFFSNFTFSHVWGNRPAIPKKPAPEAALAIAEEIDCSPAECVFVGDTSVDIITGTSAGMMSVGVTWGFRERRELEESGADIIIDSPHQLIDHVSSTF